MGIESIALCQSCMILHVFATAKYKNMQSWDDFLSRFVTLRSGGQPVAELNSQCSFWGEDKRRAATVARFQLSRHCSCSGFEPRCSVSTLTRQYPCHL